MSDERDIHYHHHIDVRGVVIPTWVAILLSFMGLTASVVVFMAVLIFRSATEDLKNSQNQQTKEIRLIDLNIQDIENILIRNGLAKRDDFVPRKGDDK